MSAVGCIYKQTAPDKLAGAMQHVIGGENCIRETLAEQLLDILIGKFRVLLNQSLSDRECRPRT